MVYFNPTTYSWKEILGPVLGKTRSWGWGTVFDLVPSVGGGVNKHVEGGELRAKPEPIQPIEYASAREFRAKPKSKAQPEMRQDRSLRRRWVSPLQEFFKNASLKPCILCIVEAKIYIFPSDPGIFRRRAETRFRSSISTF